MVDCQLKEWQDGVKNKMTMTNSCVDLQEGAQPSYSLCSMKNDVVKSQGQGLPQQITEEVKLDE